MAKRVLAFLIALLLLAPVSIPAYAEEAPSKVQITADGGQKSYENGDVQISKTIAGTELENVFDITLTVTTTTDIKTLTEDPDLAVVIVMDISNTMTTAFPEDSSTTRYSAAMVAADNFVDEFRRDIGGSSRTSRIGFVAFNTSAIEIAPMTEVETANQATNFKNRISSRTNDILSASGYAHSHKRFTNIEGGLKMGYDLIKGLPNQNKFIVF